MSKTSPSPSGAKASFRPAIEDVVSFAFPYLVVAAIALLRLQNIRPFHLVPIFASLLLFGALRPAREFPLPLLLLSAVDMLLTTRHYGYAVTVDGFVTWAAYLAAMFVGAGTLRSLQSVRRVAATSLCVSIAFFLVSNFAVWAAWRMYPNSFSGLLTCYVAALPFFRNAVISELVAAVAFFALIREAQPVLARLAPRQVSAL